MELRLSVGRGALRSVVVVVGLWVGAVGCQTEVSVPGGAQLSCAADDECPAGYHCAEALSLCVVDGQDDAVPVVAEGSLLVEPALVGRDGVLRVTFQVDEALAEPPVVTLHWNDGTSVTLLPAVGSAAPSYLYEHEPLGTEPSTPASVSVELLDLAGLRGRADAANATRFDLVDPVVVGVTSLRLVAGADNPLSAPTAVREGTRVELSFTVSEPLAADPVVQTTTPATHSFTLVTTVGLTYSYAWTLMNDSVPQGPHTLSVELRDLAGNGAPIAVIPEPFGIEVDTTAPLSPDVDSPDRIVLRRTPWGEVDGAGGVGTTVRGGAAAAAENERVAFFDVDGALLGTAETDDTGAFPPTSLGGADRGRVAIGTTDAAGNVSPTRAVRDIEWVATLAGKVPGSSLANPHEFSTRPSFRADQLVQHGGPANAAQVGRIGLADAQRESTSGAGSFWRADVIAPDPRNWPGFAPAFDGDRLRMMVFGGESSGPGTCDGSASLFCGGWIWDGASFRPLVTQDPELDGDPSPRVAPSLAYDSARRMTVLFGGNDGGLRGDTWEWNGRSWRRVVPTDPEADGNPMPRKHASMVFDETEGVMVLFGGQHIGTDCDGSGGDTCGTTWTWNGASWSRRATTGPAPRYLAAMAYDPAGRVVLYGGNSGVCNIDAFATCKDTWVWDGASWSEVVGADQPGPLHGATMVFDPASDRLLLVGGQRDTDNPPDGTLAATWSLEGSAWQSVTNLDFGSGDGSPAATWEHAMSVDRLRGDVLLFGRSSDSGTPQCAGLWRYEGFGWGRLASEKTGLCRPSGRYRAMGLYHREMFREEFIMFGGSDDRTGCDGTSGSGACDDVWGFNGRAWTNRIDPNAASPTVSARYGGAMAYDSVRQMSVLFGGSSVDGTWEYAFGGFANRCTSGCVPPSARNFSAMAALDIDPLHQVVLFGGTSTAASCDGGPSTYSCDTTWLWNGSAAAASRWTKVCGSGTACTGPSARHQTAMVFSEALGAIVLFGGVDENNVGLGDTWLWNGIAWSQPPASPETPLPRRQHMMAYDTDRGEVILWGGLAEGACNGVDTPYCDDTWSFDADGWHRLNVVDPEDDRSPPGQAEALFVEHAISGELLLYGGSRNIDQSDESWLWNGGFMTRPAHVVDIDLGTIGEDLSNVEVQRIDIDWLGGGFGRRGGDTPGATLWRWRGDQWVELSSHAAPPDTPTGLLGTLDDAAELTALSTSGAAHLHLALTPAVDNGPGPGYGEVSSDFVSASVFYRLP